MDKRTATQKKLDKLVGMPLYYCKDCMCAVDVKAKGDDVIIKRPCGSDCGAEIIAPRKAITSGDGGLSFTDTTKLFYWKLAAALTGRCV